MPSTSIQSNQSENKNETLFFDLCVVGSGCAGLTAAIEGARLGLKVVLIEHAPQIGGQTYNSIIGTFCGFYSNAPDYTFLTKIVAEEMFQELRSMNGLFEQPPGETIIPAYDELVFLRWAEKKVKNLGIAVLTETTVYSVRKENKRIDSLECITRFGRLEIAAEAFVDATGDAAIGWLAGANCRITSGVKGSMIFTLKGVNYSPEHPSEEDLNEALQIYGDKYGLQRRKGLIFYTPARGDLAVCNLTHLDILMNQVSLSDVNISGKDQVDRVLCFLREIFPQTFGNSSVCRYGQPGLRQTRQIFSVSQLCYEDVINEKIFPDRIGRTSWPVELHDSSVYRWEPFPPGHIHYIPLSCMRSENLDNYLAAGRCIDADDISLSSVRVMGPCMATGAAAAHALEMTLGKKVHDVDISLLQKRISRNLD